MEDKKKEILELLKKDIITIDESIEMLNKLHDTSVEELNEKSYQEVIESIVEKTVNDIEIDPIVQIMQNKGWTYYLKEEVVTKEEVIECMKNNVRCTLNHLVKNQMENSWPEASTATGGFYCHAWVDDGDWDNIQVELYFQPYSGFGDGHLDELVKLKQKEKIIN